MFYLKINGGVVSYAVSISSMTPNTHNPQSAKPNPEDSSKVSTLNTLTQERATKTNAIEIPQISLPKGGGALKGIDEKFQVNAANGTASFSIPLPLSPGRNGFQPSLSLGYNSGAGSSLFGAGWDLGYPSIQRKTDKKLPRYRDYEDSDTFMFSGVEDLVPVLDPDKNWAKNPQGDYRIRTYRPRIEGGFSRIERIWKKDAPTFYWKVTTRDNVVTYFGKSASHRISNPADASQVFKWLPELSFDDKGNCMLFQFNDENLENVSKDLHEINRYKGFAAFANKHLKNVKYGNITPFYPRYEIGGQKNWPEIYETSNPVDAFLFLAVLDYGEHTEHTPEEKVTWPVRPDAFSEYRAGFEMRTYRQCQRVLMFHRFTENEFWQNGSTKRVDYLVRSMSFGYQHATSDPGKLLELSYLINITQTGHVLEEVDGKKHEKSLPLLTFEYQELNWNKSIQNVAPENLANAPVGLSSGYQFTDFYGEGISGILTEQGDGWYYKENLGKGEFTIARPIMPKPSFTGLANGVLQLQDLGADGSKQIVVNSPGIQGYFELDDDNQWEPFRAFARNANIDLRDPNTRLLDINGDGLPDILISEENAFSWFPSAGRQGYDSPELAPKPFDEERGPAIVFADSIQSIFLADMSGDGLTDIVRIRNGEVCYWPNLGYGRFGAKVNMSDAPRFDTPDQFNPAYLQLADISGTGLSDIIYLGKNQFRAWLNLSGNSWSTVTDIDPFPETAQPAQISVTDLLGNGTACIVWSSPLPAHTQAPMRYIDLMGGVKPHIMKTQRNGMGKVTTVHYKSSTHFYLEDKKAGKPWITKLPFPVQCVEKVEIEDKVAGLKFTNTYSYHHGYYDHAEREFRGFGRVDQRDTEEYYDLDILDKNKKLWQPPVLTRTWFHTGAFFRRDKILHQYEEEYWYNDPVFNAVLPFDENTLPDTVVKASKEYAEAHAADPAMEDILTSLDYREAARACKGMTLRQEVFAEDARHYPNDPKALEREKIPYSVGIHNCHVMVLQPRGEQSFAVFMPLESEAITYHYERNMDDPRIAHSINLEIDELGNVLKSVAIAYGRVGNAPQMPLSITGTVVDDQSGETLDLKLLNAQGLEQLIFTETVFTVETPLVVNEFNWRLRMPCETRTYEINNDVKTGGNYYKPIDFQDFIDDQQIHLNTYEESLSIGGKNKRLIEHIRTLYRSDDLSKSLPLGEHGALGLPFESYQLAYTLPLAQDIFGGRVSASVLTNQGKYTSSADMKGLNKPFPAADPDELWWIRSGRPLFHPVAQSKARFYSPFGYEDPLGSQTIVTFYQQTLPTCYWLFLEATEDAHGNRGEVLEFDFRTLAPIRMQDANNNEMAALSDELGLVVLTAIIGKGNGLNRTGDSLAGANPYLSPAEIDTFFADPIAEAPNYIQKATTRLVYDFNKTPVRVATIAREIHENNPGGNNSPLQIGIDYTSGLGQVLLKKVQAERGDAWHVSRNAAGECTPTIVKNINPRWVGTGRSILNNKGNPVKQYEPYFSDTHEYEDEDCVRQIGGTTIIHYDPIGRVMRTDMPDGTFTKVEFNPWEQKSYDQNDTVLDSDWYVQRGYVKGLLPAELSRPADPDRAAAWLAAKHTHTPTHVYLDALGRPFFSIADNGSNQWYATWVELDVEGNQRKVVDARGNIVMAWKYDMLGHRVYQDSMDGGMRWMFNDCTGKPLYKWDNRLQLFHFQYDDLHRPVKSYVKNLTQANQTRPPTGSNGRCFDWLTYGDTKSMPANARRVAQTNNQIRLPIRQQDTAGVLEFTRYDIKGSLEQSNRKILLDHQNPVNWDAATPLAGEQFDTKTGYDALGRPVEMTTPHGTGTAPSVISIEYNEAGLLEKVKARARGNRTKTYVSNIDYNEKGQRTRIQYGNGVSTKYTYDKKTFRLSELRSVRSSDKKDLQYLQYTYDPVGNITSILDKAHDEVYFAGQVVKAHGHYTYDALYRLVEATGRELAENTAPSPYDENKKVELVNGIQNNGNAMRNYEQSYEYDEVGNMLKMIHKAGVKRFTSRWTRSFEYNNDNAHRLANGVPAHARKNNQLLNEYISARPAGGLKYRYDDHGSMTRMPHLQLMEWNAKDELAHIRIAPSPANPPSQEAWYQYDAAGQRTRKVVIKGGKRTERLYLGGFELYREYDANNNITLERESLHLMDDQQRIALIETKNISTGPPTHDSPEVVGTVLTRYQLSNHLGSAILELNDAAEAITYEEYYPYGSTAYQVKNKVIDAAAKRYRYTGMERDEESGLNYHHARFLISWLGRWVSCDPIGVGDGVNIYAYAQSNPIHLNDIGGMQSEKSIIEPHLFPAHISPALRNQLPIRFKSSISGGLTLPSSSEKYSLLVAAFQNKGLPVEFLKTVVGKFRQGEYTVGGDSLWSLLGGSDAFIPLGKHLNLDPQSLEGWRDVERSGITDLSKTGSFIHESTHTFFDIMKSNARFADIMQKGIEYYRNAPLKSGGRVTDPERVFQESVASYTENRVLNYVRSIKQLEDYQNLVNRDEVALSTEEFEKLIDEIALDYNKSQQHLVFGYQSDLLKNQDYTTQEISPDIKEFLDKEILEGKIPQTFSDSPKLTELLTNLKKSIRSQDP